MLRALFFTLLPLTLLAQRPTFDIADVHVSPRSAWVKKPNNNLQGGSLIAGRYDLRRATMLDMIKLAYGIDADRISGGPNWLDYDRFEVIAKAPQTTRPDALRQMLQSLLADRFNLSVAMDTKPMPAYLLSPGKDRSKLKPAESSATSSCNVTLLIPNQILQCRDVTMEVFAAELRRAAGNRLANLPIVDRTGIEGTWDIDFPIPAIIIRMNAPGATEPTPDPSVAIIEAIDKQLGLTLVRGTAPQPVLAVRSVNQRPSANPPGVAAALPAPPSPVFEVASIKLCNGQGGASIAPRFEAAGRVTAQCMPLMVLISQAWDLAPFQQPLGVPKWLVDSGTKTNISIEAKAPVGVQDRDSLNLMLRALLLDRYQMKVHYEDHPMDALTLTAGKPKLTKADPSNRTNCTRQPQTQGPLQLRLVCQNITLAQFAEQMQSYDSQIFYPVMDESGIEGAWDFALNYGLTLSLPVRIAAPAPTNGLPADPDGVPSFTEAVEKQLGVKLETRKRQVPILVIDQIQEMPTEN